MTTTLNDPQASLTTDELRQEIDRIDRELLALVARRRQVSAQIQHLRMAEGGPRVVHAREAEVIGRWRGALGAPGNRIAQALLELSRGSLLPTDSRTDRPG
jgi:chorismate mutase